MDDGELELLRKLTAAAAHPITRGTSRTLKFSITHDPAAEVNALPIVRWAAAIWRLSGPRRFRKPTDPSAVLLDGAMRKAEQRITREGATWTTVTGPATAVAMTARRIGWRFTSAFKVVDDNGKTIDLGETDPKGIRIAVERATERTAARRFAETKGNEAFVGGIWSAPVRRALSGRRMGPAAKAALRRAFAGGYWSKARRHAEGLCETMDCDKCGAEYDDTYHRVWECAAIEEERKHKVSEELRRKAAGADRDDPRWTRALVADPSRTVPPPRSDHAECWYFAPGVQHERWFEGIVYTQTVRP